MGKQHIHKYRRVDIGRDKPYWVMQCQLPGCSHYTPMRTKWSVPTLIGKIALCNKCSDQFVLTRGSLLKAEPICQSCVESPKKKELDKAAKFFADLEKGIMGGATE